MAKTIAVSPQTEFIPVIKELKDNNILALDNNFARTLADIDLPVRAIGEFAANMEQEAFGYATQLVQASTRPVSVNGVGKDTLKYFNEHITTYLYPRVTDIVLMALALDNAKPDLIMLHNDVEPMTRVTALWAKARGVPCLHVPHAIYQAVNRGGPGTDIHDVITASHLAVSGPFQRQWYEQRGAENVVETGLPQFDKWANMTMDRKRARRLLKIDYNEPVVTYASTWPQHTNIGGVNDEWIVAYKTFLTAVKDMPVIPIIKCHPRAGQESLKWHIEQAQQLDVPCRVTATHNEIVLAASDALVVYGGSNLILDACNVPHVRLLTIKGYEDDSEVLQVPIEPGGMADVIKGALATTRPNLAAFQHKYLGICDGQAYRRVAGVVENLLNG